MVKKFTAIFLLMISIFVVMPTWAAPDITPTAKSAVMIDASSGAVLYSKNKDEWQVPQKL